jgi:hypothetical protein
MSDASHVWREWLRPCDWRRQWNAKGDHLELPGELVVEVLGSKILVDRHYDSLQLPDSREYEVEIVWRDERRKPIDD